MGKERINKNILYMSELGILIAILLLMAFTPVGYLRIGTMTITFLTVPVVVGAIVCGPGAGTILGTISSASRASTSASAWTRWAPPSCRSASRAPSRSRSFPVF